MKRKTNISLIIGLSLFFGSHSRFKSVDVGEHLGFSSTSKEMISQCFEFGFGVRSFCPAYRRFLMADEAGFSPFGKAGVNAFFYKDPVNYEDSSGRMWEKEVSGAKKDSKYCEFKVGSVAFGVPLKDFLNPIDQKTYYLINRPEDSLHKGDKFVFATIDEDELKSIDPESTITPATMAQKPS